MINPSKKSAAILVDALPGERVAFSIKASGKAFRILIDSLYENKAGAVVREIMTNGWDSHAVAGITDPIQVTCPTALDPVFRVRDFGVSMDHETIMGLYSTIFGSSKEDTNDQVGQFGLGAKTPFAYSDTFSATAYLDGEKRTYIAVIGDDDIPMLTHVATEPQGDEPQGFEVAVPVNPVDIQRFRSEIARMVLSSDIPPVVDGMDVDEDAIVHKGEGYRVLKDHYGMGNFAIRQGCVIYPVHGRYSAHISHGYTLVADVAIGDVEVTANREALSQTDLTRDVITKTLGETDAKIQAYVDEQNEQFPNRLAAFRAYGQTNSWLQTKLGLSSIRLAPDKFNEKVPAQVLQVVKGKKIESVYHLNAQHLANLTLLVDNGEKMLRRNLRLTKYTAARRYQHVGIIQRHELPRFMRVTGLAPGRVLTLQDIPDVEIVRNGVATGGGRGRNAAPKRLAPGLYWSLKTGAMSVNRYMAGRAMYVRTTESFENYRGVLDLLGFKKGQVVFLTEAQAEALKAPANMRFETELVKRAEKYAKKHNLQDRMNNFVTATKVHEFKNGYYRFDQIQKKFGVKIPYDVRTIVDAAMTDRYKPFTGATDITRDEDHVAEVLGIAGQSLLTGEQIIGKLDVVIEPLKPILTQDDPMAFLINFYISNS